MTNIGERAELKPGTPEFSKKVQQSVYLLGTELLSLLKNQDFVPKYKLAKERMNVGRISDRPYGIVDYHTYTINLGTGFFSRNILKIEASAGKFPSPLVTLGKEFKKYEKLPEYQTLTELISGVVARHKCSIKGIQYTIDGKYYMI